jgi:putative transposase
MPQSLSFVLVHIVFSTKGRRPILNESVRPELHAYLATVARGFACDCFRVGGVADHVHLAVHLHATKCVAELVKELKTSSSMWLKRQGVVNFAWQRGYAVFSVSPADNGALMQYIETQEAHHRKRDYQAEMRAFFEKYHVPFDERYVWD